MSTESREHARTECAEVARLLPVPAERALPGGRHHILKEHLMREVARGTAVDADAFRPRPRRRWALAAVPLAAGALGVALAAGGVLDRYPAPDGAASAPSTGAAEFLPAAVLLDRVATVAGSRPAPAVRDDQYVHVISTVAYSSSTGRDPVRRLDEPHRREVWLSVDGSRPGLLKERGEELALDARPEGTDRAASLNAPTYRYLASLPTDPDILLKKVYDETAGVGPGEDQEAFVTIGDLLGEQMAPPEVSAALYRSAARIPGVTVVNDAVDAVGRHGVAVARVHDGERTEWIFDEHTLEYLGERSVMVEDTAAAGKGRVTAVTAVTSRGVTDGPGRTVGRTG
ncbi:CU044_5270 family protein [Streptomyces sp. NPDC055607]